MSSERWLRPLEVGTMDRVKPALEVVDGKPSAGTTPLAAAYEHVRLNRMGNRASPNTLAHYDAMVRPFLAWAVDEGVRRFEDLGVERLRHYRALLASRESAYGRRWRVGACSTRTRRS